MRYLGTFLADPLDVPAEVVDYLSPQSELATAPSRLIQPVNVIAIPQLDEREVEHASLFLALRPG